MRFKFLILCVLIFSLFWACEKDPTDPNNIKPDLTLSGALIVNEGSFSAANSSLSFLDMISGTMYQNVFENINSENLGSIGNSVFVSDTLAYIVVNNSHKIEVISTNTFKQVKRIKLPAGSSPRQLVLVNENTAYVSSLYKNKCYRINPGTGQVTDSVSVGPNPEGVVSLDGRVFVANSGFGFGNSISVIDVESNTVEKTLTVSDNPISAVTDGTEYIYVLGSGSYGADFFDPADDTPAFLWKIDAVQIEITDSLRISGHPSRFCIGPEGKGYAIGETGIIEFNLDGLEISNPELIPGSFYGLSYDTVSDKIFVTDAKDFQQNGELLIFDTSGNQVAKYPAGLIPGAIGFIYQ